jgi:uncharacterized protein YjiK
VEEMPIYAGKNLFEITTGGSLVKTATTTGYSNEPTGLTYNPNNNHLYVSDDNYQRIFDLNPGTDTQYGTADDTVTYFSTSAFGCTDPEGVAYGQGNLYIISGTQRTVYKTTLSGSLLATLIFPDQPGLQDSEGITYDPTVPLYSSTVPIKL